MATSRVSNRAYTPRGIAAFANLHVPRARKDAKGNPKGDPKYGLGIMFPKGTDLSELEELAQRIGEEKFGATFMAKVQKGKINWPFTDTEEMDEPTPPCDKPGTLVNFKRREDEGKPGIVDKDGEPLMEKGDVYSGMICRASVRCYAYDNESQGVTFGLVNVQKLADGERLSGDPDAESDFAKAPPVGGKKPNRTVAPSKKSRDTDIDDLL